MDEVVLRGRKCLWDECYRTEYGEVVFGRIGVIFCESVNGLTRMCNL